MQIDDADDHVNSQDEEDEQITFRIFFEVSVSKQGGKKLVWVSECMNSQSSPSE